MSAISQWLGVARNIFLFILVLFIGNFIWASIFGEKAAYVAWLVEGGYLYEFLFWLLGI